MPLDMTTLGVTDEALAVRASADYFLLAPKDQRLAEGSDGAFGPSDRWTMSSTSVGFEAQGVALGSMFRLKFPVPAVGGRGATTRDEVVAVESVAGQSVTFRRKGVPAGQGSPPVPVGGAAGVAFDCLTMLPQVRDVAGKVKQRFGLSVESDLKAPSDFEIAIILDVLADLYLDQSRMAGDAVRDSFIAKYKLYRAELALVGVRLDVLYSEPSANSFVFSAAPCPPRPFRGWGEGGWSGSWGW